MKRENTFFKFWNKFSKKESFENVIDFPIQYRKCEFCNSKANWKHVYMINQYTCNECVPKNCGCTIYEKRKNSLFSVENYDYLKNKVCEDWEKFDQ